MQSKRDNSTYIIAEIGINHNGDLRTARQLIEAAHEAGVDAVKFQKRNLDKIYTKEILDNPNSAEWNFEYLIPILKEVELPWHGIETLSLFTRRLGMDFIVTPFDVDSAKRLGDMKLVDAFKIGSMDMMNFPLITECLMYDIPLYISTGMWNEEDIREVADNLSSDPWFTIETPLKDITFLLANSTYPTPYEVINIKFLDRLKRIISPFDKIGYSGHERGGHIPVAAVAMGATVVEKHITFDRNQTGPDHKASMLPPEFKEMVKQIRDLELASGERKVVNQAERLAKQTFVRGTYATEDLKVEDKVLFSNVEFLCPGKGILMHNFTDFEGLYLTLPVKKGENITESHFAKTTEVKDWEIPNYNKKWGVKCRFHDFEEYNTLEAPVIEFHMSETDLETKFMGKSDKSELIVHAPEMFDRKLIDICSEDESIASGSIRILQETIDKTLEIAKRFPKARPKLVCHLGGMSLAEAVDPLIIPRMMQRAVENFKKLNYDPSDIDILPENLPPRPWYFGGQYFQYGFMDSEDMADFCDKFDLDMTFDCCHAALYCNHKKIALSQYAQDVEHFTKHVHLSDAIGIDGEGIQVGEGTIDFNSLMKSLEPNKDFTWVTEIWQGHDNKGAGTYYSMHQLSKYKGIL